MAKSRSWQRRSIRCTRFVHCVNHESETVVSAEDAAPFLSQPLAGSCYARITSDYLRLSDNPATQHKKRNSPLESTKTWSVAVGRVVATLGTMFLRGQFASSPIGRDTSRNSSIRRLLHAATMFGQALASASWTREKDIGRTSALTTRQSRVQTNTSERRERRDRKGKRFHRRDLVYAECRGSGAPVGSRPHADTDTTVPQISPDGWSAGSGVTNGELCPMPVEGTTSRRN